MPKQSKYTWDRTQQRSSFRLPRTRHAGRIITMAVVFAILSHVAVIYWLQHWSFERPAARFLQEVETDPIVVREMEFREALPEMEEEEIAEPEKIADESLDEMEILEEIPLDTEVDFTPEVDEIALDSELLDDMAAAGLENLGPEATEAPLLENELPDLGTMETILQPAIAGQIVIDPGKQEDGILDPDAYLEELAKQGADGLANSGNLGEFTPLSAMAKMNSRELVNTKGMIGSDLLFEFNKADLQQGARLSLLKVALLIDKNPGLNCWIEGHTDTIGSAQANAALSQRRAQAVKDWLVRSMKIESDRLIAIGYGKARPIVPGGDKDAQAANRRVIIKMRKGLPPLTPGMTLEAGGLPTQDLAPEAAKPLLIKPKGPPVLD
ncbi:OmpA family protein [Rubritalea marina]|uniref:OmpA family protein n=1 Tax=Rubritalea marina TaxID=361055 RepID=UPI0014614778|nr:OmpA family protein [Rubritalea marina]